METKPGVIVIVGPTACGKTKVSIELAKRINGEIVSADSMQIYRLMNIGTAKPDIEEMNGIRHHMIDIIDPKEEFSVARYKTMAEQCIDDIIARGKSPIVAGGTGLYINSLADGIEFSETVTDWPYREELRRIANEQGPLKLYDMLGEVDAETAQRLHPNDIKRVIRALEVYKCTGKPISYHKKLSRLKPPKYHFIMAGLNMDRERLYKRIEIRVDDMLQRGLIQEVRELKERGYSKHNISMQGLGYKEIIDYLDGILTYQQAVDLLKMMTRRYAKRQLTWFRRDERIRWFDSDTNLDDVIEKIINYIEAVSKVM